MSLRIRRPGPAATAAVAAGVARTLLPGDVLLLDGDLGAGQDHLHAGPGPGHGRGASQ